MTPAAHLRQGAEAISAALPGLVLSAEALAAAVQPGQHGRRRAGMGEDFWQYRPAHAGDTARMIDWRRSGRADAQFVRDREWQAAQALSVWVDPAGSMTFTGAVPRPTKAARARKLALALMLLALRGGERAGLALPGHPPRAGRGQLPELAARLLEGCAVTPHVTPRGRMVMISDGLGDPAPLRAAMAGAAAQGVRGAFLQLLDPVEESFPFTGRVILHEGARAYETRSAADLRGAYQDRLAARRAELEAAARDAGWRFGTHVTDRAPLEPLIWAVGALGGLG